MQDWASSGVRKLEVVGGASAWRTEEEEEEEKETCELCGLIDGANAFIDEAVRATRMDML
jgi:hypothetical protein